MCTGLRREWVLSGLRHEVRDVQKHRGLNDAALLDSVELSEAEHREAPGWQYAQQRFVEQTHEMTHLHDPATLEPVNFVQAGDEYVGTPLQLCDCRQERYPELVRDRSCAALRVEWMYATPMPVRSDMTL
jgi:hypothetical protein